MPKKLRRRKVASARLVVKDNKLINARYNLGVSEMRLFLTMITKIQRDDSDFQTYRIQISDFADTLGTQSKNIYERAKETSRRLMEEVLEIEEEDGPVQLALLSRAKYYTGKGYVDLRFDPALKPYLLQLKETFTAYDIRNVLQLQSGHSIRIFELLKQYEKIGERTIDVDELKEILGVMDQYSRYNDFKRYVLLQAQKELVKHCDINFEFEEMKQGRKIVSIHFIIKRSKSLPYSSSLKDDSESDLMDELLKMGLSKKQAKAALEGKPEAAIRSAVAYTQKRYRSTKGTEAEIRNVAAYLLRVLEFGTGEPEFVAQEKKAEQLALELITQDRETKEAQQKAEKLILELQSDYRRYRKDLHRKRAQKASESDWQAFKLSLEDNPYLKSKYVEAGELNRNIEGIESWLGSFLTNRELPDIPETFIDWAFQEKGYMLEATSKVGEIIYRLTGKQEQLIRG